MHAAYAGEVTMTDHWLGHFLDRFHELGLHKNTVIVLLSDHGYLLGERGYTGKVPSQLHPELAQVPFIVVHPDDRAAGEVSQHFASTHDVGPTVLSMVGIDRPSWMNGTDLSVLMEGGTPSDEREFHYGGMYNRFFIRTDDWVLIGDNQGNERTLCDLRVDPHEFENVVEGEPQGQQGAVRHDPGRGRRAAAVLRVSASAQRVARGRGRDSTDHRRSEVERCGSGLSGVGLHHDLDRERREGREAAEEADADSLADVPREPTGRDEQAEQERADDVDRNRRPQQSLVMKRRARDAVAAEHAEQAPDPHEERRHSGEHYGGHTGGHEDGAARSAAVRRVRAERRQRGWRRSPRLSP